MAGSAELHEPAVVHHAVDDGRLELVVGEDRALPADLDAGGEYHAPSLVAVRYDLVQESRPVHVEGHVAELVQDQEHRLARGHLARRCGGEMPGGIGFCRFPRDNLLARYARRARYASQLSHSPGLSLDAPLYFPGHSTRVFSA